MPRKRIEDEPNELRLLREKRKLSQQKAADLVGVSRPMWSSWECRARQMTLTQLNRIQEQLSLSDLEVERVRKWWTHVPEEPVPIAKKGPVPKKGKKEGPVAVAKEKPAVVAKTKTKTKAKLSPGRKRTEAR